MRDLGLMWDDFRYLALRLGMVVIIMVMVFVALDWRKSRRIYILPNLSFMLSVAAYLCLRVLWVTGGVEQWLFSWVAVATWSSVFALAIVAQVKSSRNRYRTGRKRSWVAIALCILFAGEFLYWWNFAHNFGS